MNAAEIISIPEIVMIPVDSVGVNPYQPRKVFDRGHLEELAESIRLYGVIQPISVRLINGSYYELVAGERRLRASKMVGLRSIPAVIVNISDRDSAVLALIENLQRENLNYLEEAEGFANLISDYAFTQEQLARQIGKSQSTIANKLRILKLPKQTQKILIDNNLSERHARALLRLESEEQQLEVLKKVIANELNVKKTEELIESVIKVNKEQEAASRRRKQIVKPYIRDLRLFTNTIAQAVDIMNNSGVNTVYDIEDNSDGCFISIMVTY